MWTLASWNVRTLLDVEGPIETARQGDNMQVVDERKIDQVVDEQGTRLTLLHCRRQSGSEKVSIEWESVVLVAGRPVPRAGVVRQRGEGVAIVLSGLAVGAWKTGGSCWKA